MRDFKIAVVVIGLGVLGLAGLFGLGFLVQGENFALYKFFAPREEQVRHDVFKQSQAYNDGVAQELGQMRLDYARAKTAEEKGAIRGLVMHEVAGYDTSKLPSNLQSFVSKVRSEEGVQ